MVDDNISDDPNEKSLLVSDEGSRNKTKFVSEFPRYKLLEPLKGGCSQSDEEQDVDWEDAIISQLLELLTQNLSTIFQSAVKMIAKCGYSERTAERVILRSGLYHGRKDVVSNVVDGALALLSKEKVFDIARYPVFANFRSLVDYTLVEMVCVLREVNPALTVAEAMWYLLISDLNLVHACTMEGDHLVELHSQESRGGSSSGLKLSESKTEASENTQSNPDKQQLSKVPVPQEPKCENSHVGQAAKGKGSSTPLPKAEVKSKKDWHRRKTHQFENCRGRTAKNIKENITAWGSLVLGKKLNSSDSSDASNISVKSNKPLAKASSDSPCPSSSIAPATGTSSVRDPDSLPMEPKSSIQAPDNTSISSAVPDYYAGIPYDESLGKYVPQNEKDETVLLLTSRLKTLQNDLQGWSDWANEKVMQATRRLIKDQAELKMLRQAKEVAEKAHQEMQMLKENTMKRIMEMEEELVKANDKFETSNAHLNTLKRENVGLMNRMEALTLSTGVYATNVDNALAKELEAVKKCQAADVEKQSFEEDLSTNKQKTVALQKQQEKANKVVDHFEVLLKQEERMKQRFLQQADSLIAEKEQLRVQGKVQQDNFTEKVEKDMQKYKEEIQKRESEISQLRLQSERSKIEALKRGIPQMTESSGSNVVKMERECVMCMNEQISVVFLPCAHQVLCEDCNVLHQNKGMDECLSCRTPIKERISVRYPGSE